MLKFKKEIFKLINQKNKDDIIKLINKQLGVDGLERLEEQLKECDDDYNLESMIDEIISFKVDDSLLSCFNQNENYFKGPKPCRR